MSQDAVTADKNVHLIKLPKSVDASNVESFERETAQWLLDPAILHVFDFADTIMIDQKFFRVISVYRRSLVKNGKFLASINMRADLIFTVSQMGMSAAFNPVDSLDKARVQAGLSGGAKPKMKLDTGILTPFIEGTINTLQTQANVPITTGKPFIKDGKELPIAIAGVITMNNAEMPGSIALCFSKEVFLGIYESMVGEKHEEITAETQDAAGELLNIIYGHAKTKLKAGGFTIDMAIPVILAGEKLTMQIGERGKTIVVPFECPYGAFYLEIYFKKS